MNMGWREKTSQCKDSVWILHASAACSTFSVLSLYCLNPQTGLWHRSLVRSQQVLFSVCVIGEIRKHFTWLIFVIMLQHEGKKMFFSFTISHGLEKAGGGSTCPEVIFWTAPENALGTIITIISMSVYNRIMLVMGEQRGANSLIMCLLQISKQLRTGGPQGRVQLSSFQHVYVLFRNSTASKQSSQWLLCLVIYEQRLHIFHYPCVKVRGPYPKFCV